MPRKIRVSSDYVRITYLYLVPRRLFIAVLYHSNLLPALCLWGIFYCFVDGVCLLCFVARLTAELERHTLFFWLPAMGTGILAYNLFCSFFFSEGCGQR